MVDAGRSERNSGGDGRGVDRVVTLKSGQLTVGRRRRGRRRRADAARAGYIVAVVIVTAISAVRVEDCNGGRRSG